MSRYTKLATCLFIVFIGLVGYFIYLGLERPPRTDLSVETIEGDARFLEDWELAGAIEVADRVDQTHAQPSYQLAQLGYSPFRPDRRFEFYTWEEGETQLSSDLSFFEELDNTSEYDRFLSELRLEYPGFMRNKSLLFVHVLETDTQVVTGNFKGDYDLAEASHASELVIDVLEKETEESKEHVHSLDLDAPLDNRVQALYQTDHAIYTLVSSTVSGQNGLTYTLVELDKETEEFSEHHVTSGYKSAMSNIYENTPIVLFEETDHPSEDAYDEQSVTGYQLFHLETGEMTELPTYTDHVEEDNMTFTPTLSEGNLYTVILNEESDQIDLLHFDEEAEEWMLHQEIEILIDEDIIHADYEEISHSLEALNHSIQNGYFIVYTYWSDQSTPLHVQATDLETGELAFFGTIDLKNAADFTEYSIGLYNLRPQP